ncbi:protein PLASTID TRANSCRIPTIONALLY ACTIVE 14-like [Miscanthus floridulus]|uniref:protein PLASTID TRANSCRIPTIONALLY ACTIVE 14-like n=1 Tax=Miscanthus floridulus TaxID=154761 RepID=UPI003459D1C3
MATPTASALLSPSLLPNPSLRRTPWRPVVRRLPRPLRAGRPRLQAPPPAPPPVAEDALERDETPPLRLLEPPQEDDPFPPEMEPADPDFYRIGYARMMRAYGIEFLEGPDGMGVYASRDVEPLRRARVIMEIPLELMLTITQKKPWMFFPDIIPLGHPIFDIIESTDPETDWDLRLACLLLYAFDIEDNFWQLYSDFLPSADECTSLLLAPKEDLMELEDEDLASQMLQHQRRAIDFWQKHWDKPIPLKLKRLACDHERFLWALSIVQSRSVNLKLRMGAFIQDANVLAPYADMLNHSPNANCFLHWRFKDRMLEVMIKAGHAIKKGDEMTIDYMSGMNSKFMERYGFSSPTNPWELINFSSPATIHMDSFSSVFNIAGLHDELYHNSALPSVETDFVDGAVVAAARALPTWSDGDVPAIPSVERKSAQVLQEECRQMLDSFSTTIEEDQQILDSDVHISKTREIAIKYRLHRKMLLQKIMDALDIYQDKILF